MYKRKENIERTPILKEKERGNKRINLNAIKDTTVISQPTGNK